MRGASAARRAEVRTTPRAGSGEVLRQLDGLAHVSDDLVRVPGLGWRVGIDPIIGMIPGLGDVTSTVMSVSVRTKSTSSTEFRFHPEQGMIDRLFFGQIVVDHGLIVIRELFHRGAECIKVVKGVRVFFKDLFATFRVRFPQSDQDVDISPFKWINRFGVL